MPHLILHFLVEKMDLNKVETKWGEGGLSTRRRGIEHDKPVVTENFLQFDNYNFVGCTSLVHVVIQKREVF